MKQLLITKLVLCFVLGMNSMIVFLWALLVCYLFVCCILYTYELVSGLGGSPPQFGPSGVRALPLGVGHSLDLPEGWSGDSRPRPEVHS